MSKKLVIRFDGPPSHESGRFIEVELDGASVSYGEWEQDGDDWLLVLPDADAKAAQLEEDLRIEKQKHLDTSNWTLEQQDRADKAEAENGRLRFRECPVCGRRITVLFGNQIASHMTGGEPCLGSNSLVALGGEQVAKEKP